MRGHDNLLFYGSDLFQFLQANWEGAKNDVDQIQEDQFINSNDEDIVEHVYSRREVIPIELHENRKVMETRETKVDVRHDFNRAINPLKSHPNLISPVRINQPGEWRIRIRAGEDADREIILHVFLFNLYVPEKGKENVRAKS